MVEASQRPGVRDQGERPMGRLPVFRRIAGTLGSGWLVLTPCQRVWPGRTVRVAVPTVRDFAVPNRMNRAISVVTRQIREPKFVLPLIVLGSY